MTNSIKIKIVLFNIGVLLLMGCSGKGWFRDRSNDYTEAKSYPTIEVPTETHAQKFSEEYQIPK